MLYWHEGKKTISAGYRLSNSGHPVSQICDICLVGKRAIKQTWPASPSHPYSSFCMLFLTVFIRVLDIGAFQFWGIPYFRFKILFVFCLWAKNIWKLVNRNFISSKFHYCKYENKHFVRVENTDKMSYSPWNYVFPSQIFIIIVILNMKDWNLWSVPSPGLQLLSSSFLRSSNRSSSLWPVVVWFYRDSVLWHSFEV